MTGAGAKRSLPTEAALIVAYVSVRVGDGTAGGADGRGDVAGARSGVANERGNLTGERGGLVDAQGGVAGERGGVANERGERAAVAPVLSDVRVEGHEADPARHFPLCTALSMHVRTLLHLIRHTPAIRADIETPHPGSTTIDNIAVSPELRTWFAGASALFLQGLHDLAHQFPKAFVVRVSFLPIAAPTTEPIEPS